MKKRIAWISAFFFIAGVFIVQAGEQKGKLPEVPAPGMVTMVDLGAKTCIPCRMMAPIIEKLKKRYHGKASIIFIDVWEHEDQVKKYGIRAIPTQIFFDASGKEVYRNVGFMGEGAIVRQLEKMGVPPVGETARKTGALPQSG
jgi:thioredoxin 1